MFRLRSYERLWLASAVLSLAACRASVPARDVAAAPTDEVTVVDGGDASQPSVSPDGKRLLFVAAKRPGHVGPQVYVKDLVTRTEKRVTFQSGVVARPRFHPRDDVILYASSTDEDKENPVRLREDTVATRLPTWLRPATEVYEHDLGTYDVKRVTTFAGGDADPRFTRRGRALTWTRVTGDRTAVMTMARGGRSAGAVEIKNLGSNPTEFALAEDDRTAAWVGFDKSFDVSRLMLRQWNKVGEIAADRRSLKVDVAFSPDGLYLLWAEFDATRNAFGIFARNLLDDCTREVAFLTPGNRRHPALANDGTLYYTAVDPVRSRISSTRFAFPKCP